MTNEQNALVEAIVKQIVESNPNNPLVTSRESLPTLPNLSDGPMVRSIVAQQWVELAWKLSKDLADYYNRHSDRWCYSVVPCVERNGGMIIYGLKRKGYDDWMHTYQLKIW